jgi:subtilisin family serine protease
LAEESPKELPPHLNLVRLKEAEAAERAAKYELNEVVVAVLDTGVDRAHPDLQSRMFAIPNREPTAGPSAYSLRGFTYWADAFGVDSSWEPSLPADVVKLSPGSADVGGPGTPCPTTQEGAVLASPDGTDCGHGSHVAGIISGLDAQPPEAAGASVRGVCRNCKILGLRAASINTTGPQPNNGKILDSSQIRSMQFAVSLGEQNKLYVNVLNMSIGQYTSTRGMRNVIESLAENGIVLVAAAANNNTDRPAFPASYDQVVSVCATSYDGEMGRGNFGKAEFSNFGEWVDICAPGENIVSTVPGATYKQQSGTSMAAPLVAGAAGYLMGLGASLKIPAAGRARAIIERILTRSNWEALYAPNTAPQNEAYQFELPDKTGVEFLGRGFLDIENALSVSRMPRRFTPPKPQVERGCVASAIGKPNPRAVGDFFSGVPFLLGAFLALMRIVGSRRLRPMHRAKVSSHH